MVSWGDNLRVDQPQIDAQHQAIFDIALEIADIWHQHGDLDKLKALTDKLGRVLEAHFRFEEAEPGFLVLSYVLGVTVGHITHSDMGYAELARKPSGTRGGPRG